MLDFNGILLNSQYIVAIEIDKDSVENLLIVETVSSTYVFEFETEEEMLEKYFSIKEKIIQITEKGAN